MANPGMRGMGKPNRPHELVWADPAALPTQWVIRRCDTGEVLAGKGGRLKTYMNEPTKAALKGLQGRMETENAVLEAVQVVTLALNRRTRLEDERLKAEIRMGGMRFLTDIITLEGWEKAWLARPDCVAEPPAGLNYDRYKGLQED